MKKVENHCFIVTVD